MKKDVTEYLGFENEDIKKKVGRPKLADKNTKRKSLIIAALSFFAVTLLLIFGYGSLFGFRSTNLLGTVNNINSKNLKKTETSMFETNIKICYNINNLIDNLFSLHSACRQNF